MPVSRTASRASHERELLPCRDSLRRTFVSKRIPTEHDYIPLELMRKLPSYCTITVVVGADLTDTALYDQAEGRISFPAQKVGHFLIDDQKIRRIDDDCYEVIKYQPKKIEELPQNIAFKLYKYTLDNEMLNLVETLTIQPKSLNRNG